MAPPSQGCKPPHQKTITNQPRVSCSIDLQQKEKEENPRKNTPNDKRFLARKKRASSNNFAHLRVASSIKLKSEISQKKIYKGYFIEIRSYEVDKISSSSSWLIVFMGQQAKSVRWRRKKDTSSFVSAWRNQSFFSSLVFHHLFPREKDENAFKSRRGAKTTNFASKFAWRRLSEKV